MGQLARQRDMYRIMAEEAGTPTTAMSAPRTPPLSAGHPQVSLQSGVQSAPYVPSSNDAQSELQWACYCQMLARLWPYVCSASRASRHVLQCSKCLKSISACASVHQGHHCVLHSLVDSRQVSPHTGLVKDYGFMLGQDCQSRMKINTWGKGSASRCLSCSSGPAIVCQTGAASQTTVRNPAPVCHSYAGPKLQLRHWRYTALKLFCCHSVLSRNVCYQCDDD